MSVLLSDIFVITFLANCVGLLTYFWKCYAPDWSLCYYLYITDWNIVWKISAPTFFFSGLSSRSSDLPSDVMLFLFTALPWPGSSCGLHNKYFVPCPWILASKSSWSSWGWQLTNSWWKVIEFPDECQCRLTSSFDADFIPEEISQFMLYFVGYSLLGLDFLSRRFHGISWLTDKCVVLSLKKVLSDLYLSVGRQKLFS